jgi:hypothetical protein
MQKLGIYPISKKKMQIASMHPSRVETVFLLPSLPKTKEEERVGIYCFGHTKHFEERMTQEMNTQTQNDRILALQAKQILDHNTKEVGVVEKQKKNGKINRYKYSMHDATIPSQGKNYLEFANKELFEIIWLPRRSVSTIWEQPMLLKESAR